MSLNILLVDDSDIIRAMIERTLKLTDLPIATVHHASNGKQALDMLSDEWVDLVLADLNMPVMDGAEMLRVMREQDATRDVPVIIVSTEGATQRIDALAANDVSAWVRKPFTPEEIRDVVTGVTETWRTRPGVGKALNEVFGQIIETFAFVFPEQADSPVDYKGEDLVRAEIAFKGAVSGNLSIVAPFGLCAEMAANAMGLEPDDDEATCRAADTLGEIVNITAGHLCTQLEQHAPTHLLPPIVSRTGSLQEASSVGTTVTYLVDGNPMRLQVVLRPSEAA